MKTGAGKKFRMDQDILAKSDQHLKEGNGLFGGDLNRNPKAFTPLRVSFEHAESYQINTLEEDAEKQEAQLSFARHVPVEIEMGFGNGQFLANRALRFPETHFIGFEIHRFLCLNMIKRLHSQSSQNAKICFEDARLAMQKLLNPSSLSRCSIFFPDPWWKKRHIKRRIFSPMLLDLLVEYMIPQTGLIHIKTDVLEYADIIEQMFAEDSRFELMKDTQDWFEGDLPTEREAYCIEKNLPFREFCYVTRKS